MKRKSETVSVVSRDAELEISRMTRAEMRKGTLGKYAVGSRVRVVGLDPDVARVFRNSESVNKALRAIIQVIPMVERNSRKSA
jgi:hypothetical protein